MKINRLNPQHKRHTVKPKPTRRRKHYVNQAMQQNYASFVDELNKVGKFTYLDYNRNQGAIQLFKSQVNQLISNYGCDLQYFRKYNTFFKGQEQNNSNLIYGQDTTAQYYASGMIRSFVSVENMAWNFNQLGLQNTEQVNILISIDNFSQIFSKLIAKEETKRFEVPVSGNTINNEAIGQIKCDQFDAKVYAQFSDDLKVKQSKITMVPKAVNSLFYKSNNYNSSIYQISGHLTGKLKFDDCYPNLVSGVLKGDLTYYNYQNKEDSSTWNLAPQVGDYFKFTVGSGIDEEWEITQVFDRILTNKSGINPLLGKYIYQCSAIKRVSSYQKNDLNLEVRQPGQDIDQLFNQTKKKQQKFADQYIQKNGRNVHNQKTQSLAKNVFDYTNKDDEVYGGYQNKPNSK